jgi:hypothetical protein
MRLSFTLLTASLSTTAQAFIIDNNNIININNEEDTFGSSNIDPSHFNHHHHQQQQQEDVVSTSSRGRRLLNKRNFPMIGRRRPASQRWIGDADVGVLSVRPEAQYLHPHQERRVEEDDESAFNDTNITTPFDYLYDTFCNYLNCTCSNINEVEQTMEAVCEVPFDHCSTTAIYACAAELTNSSCTSYELNGTLKIIDPTTFENRFCKVRSMPYYEKTCWYISYENVTLKNGHLEHPVKECTMAFNGEICNSCKAVPTRFDYCYPDGTCINTTFQCNEFDCTNTAQGESFLKECIISD